jgi:glycosyltransferase involved in cell wall biosynthesis
MRLVFTGHMSAELAEYIVHNRMLQSVHFIGLVPDAELPSLYRSAKALLFASLYEGFGLPVIEAMACGTPVVTSNITALPEIAGDAALLVDPTSVEQIATALRQIIEDSSLRQKLRAGGLARAAEFSWSRTTSRVRDLVTRLTSER